MVSVLMSVYFKESPVFFEQALYSICDQQSFKPSQIVLVKDGRLTPELDDVIDKFKERLGDVLKIVALPENVGLGNALNAGLKQCQYELVARMDTDDVASPDRLAKQVTFMLSHPEISASSAGLEEYTEDLSRKIGERLLPADPKALRKFSKVRSPLSHPVSIYRKSDVLSVGGYPPLRKAQDYGLWSLLLVNGYNLANLPDVLLKMRTGDGLLERRGWEYFKQEIKLLKFQKDIGFLECHSYCCNILLKGVLRLSPNFIKRLAYRCAR